MRMNERMKKYLSILLCLCMLVQNCPVVAFAAETDNLCEHHTQHTAECGYAEGSAGSPCTHEHSEDCYQIVACKHSCGDECANGCTHECTVENGCITMELDCHHVHGDCGYSEGTAEVPCGHVHNESCGYAEAVAGNPCANAETNPECDHTGDCGFVAAIEGQPCRHTEHLGCGYQKATEGTPCTHTHAVKVDSTDSCYKLLCSHKDGGHDDACGYAAAVEAHECHYECAECAAAPASEEPSEESSEPAPVCDCGTDDPAIHATTCGVYVAPENPVCYCTEKCSDTNIWCDVCGVDYSKCGGTDTAAVYADEWFTVSGNTVTIDGTLGGKTTAEESDITALVDAIKGYVDSGITTIIVTGNEPPMIEVGSFIMPAVSEALYRLTNETSDSPYCGTIDLILPDVTEIVDDEFNNTYALNSITLPKVTTVGDGAFYATRYLQTLTFGSVITFVNEESSGPFHMDGYDVGGCDLVLNCGQLQAEEKYKPNFETNVWFIGDWSGEYEWKSITLTHTEGTAATCTAQAVCSVCDDSYGEVDADAHSYGDWNSNGDGTHTRTCVNDPSHTDGGDCSGGTATCKEKAVCDICKTAYGELADHTAEPTYAPNAGDSTQHDVTYSCCGATVTEAHTMDVTTGKCVCGADMTVVATVTDGTNTYYAADADTLNQAVTAILESGSRTFTVELPADAPAGMITAIRRAICDTEDVADGSINLTLKGVTTIPGTTNWDGVAFGPGDIYDEAGKPVDTKYVTQLASINLPNVTHIGDQAFLDCSNLTSITAPNVQYIGNYGLQGTGITSIDMPLLKETGYAAFFGTALTEISLPSLETVGDAAFRGCEQLQTVDLPKLQNLSQILFGNCTSLVFVNVPEATSVEKSIFWHCSELVSITLPRVTELAEDTFEGCTKLENITLGSVITSVNANLFGSDSSLSSNITLTLSCGQGKADTLPATAGINVEWAGFTWKEVKFAHSYVDGKCKFCNEPCSEHTGGTATCTTLAVCEACGESYGELGNHSTTAEGDRAATCKELAYCSVCDSEYGEKNPDNHASENYTYTDNGDGTHSKVHECGVTVGEPENHTIENHVCTACGAMEIVVSFDAGDYEWESGDQIKLLRRSTGDNGYPVHTDYYFTATVAEDGTVTWTPDKSLYWDGTGEHTLNVSYPDMDLTFDNFGIPADQSDIEKLREADLMNAMWSGNPTTDPITFNLKHRLAKVTVNYEVAKGVTISKAEVYTLTQYMFFDIYTLERRNVAWEEGYDLWINSYLDGNQFTAFVSPDAYAADGNFIRITLSDGTVREVKMNKAVTFAEGGEYTYKVIITADGAYLVCADECSFEYTANEDGLTHSKTCSKCGYVAASEAHTLTYTANGNTITATCSANCGHTGTATITADNSTYDGTAKKTANVTYSEGWKGGELTVSYENNTNAGTATASITIEGKTASVDFTIEKAAPTLTAPEAITGLIYNGSNQALVEEGQVVGGTLQYSLDNVNWSAEIPTATNAGEYTVYYMVVADANHNDIAAQSLTVTIGKATTSIAFDHDYNPSGEYNGVSLINPTAGSVNITGATYNDVVFTWYKDSVDEANKLSVAPKDAGTYYVVAAIPESNNTSASSATSNAITISPMEVTAPTITLAQNSFAYDGTAKTPAVTSVVYQGHQIPASEYTVSYSNNTNVGSATVTITDKDGGNFTVSGSTTFEITKAAAVATAAPTPNDLTYTGQAQNLINGGEATGGTMQYSTDNQNWSTTIPQGTDAGKYTVYYKVVGDANHSDIAVDSVEVTIAKAQAVITVDTTTISVTYGEAVTLPTATTNFGTVVCDKTADDLVNAGTYTVTYSVEGTANYEGAEKKLTVTVEKKEVAEPTVTGTYTYTGNEQTATLTGVESYMTVASGNKGTNAGNYEVVITLDGNHEWADGFDGKLQWSIGKAQAEIRVNTAPITVTYGEKVTLPTASTNFGTVSCDKTAADLKNAGTYTVSFRVAGTGNYEGDTKTVQVVVEQKAVAEPTVTGTYTYTGEEQTVTLSGFDSSYMTIASGSKGTNVGNYEVVIALDGNHKWADGSDGSCKWSIAKAKAEITVDTAPITVTYGETVNLPEATTNFGTVSSDKASSDLVNAGTYTVTYTVGGTDNYDGDTKSVTVTINPKPITVTGATIADVLYDESGEYTLTVTGVTLDGVVDGDTLVMGVDFQATASWHGQNQVGEQQASVTISMENPNYNSPVLPFTATFRIVKHEHLWNYSVSGDTITAKCTGHIGECDVKTVTIKLNAPAELSYDGEAKTVTVSQSSADFFTDLPAVEYVGDRKNTGDHTAKLTYGGVTAELTFTITCEHSYTPGEYVWNSDNTACTVTGTCEKGCGATAEAKAAVTSQQTKDPTCTEKGETTYTATFAEVWAAQQTKTVADVAALEHSWTVTYSWSEDGKRCTAAHICGNDEKHNVTEIAAAAGTVKTPATCEEMGWTTYTANFNAAWAVDGQTKDVQDIPVAPHTPGTPVEENRVESTCTVAGSYDEVIYCSVCKTHEISRETKALALAEHTPDTAVEENRVESTCTVAGSYDEVVYCSVCKTHEISRVKKDLALAEHTPAAPVEENREESTCTKAGSYDEVIYCSVCKTHEISRAKKDLALVDHTPGDPVEENREESTCTVAGSYDEVIYCSVCKTHEISRETKALALAEHSCDESKWKYDAEKHWNECSVCMGKFQEAGHVPGAEATETTAQTCTICGAVLTPALGHTHSYGEPVYSWSADYQRMEVTISCSCGDNLTAIAESTSRITDATCTQTGKTVYTATAVLNGKNYTDTKEVTIAKKEHTYGQPTFHWTEDNACEASYTCSVGGETETVACVVTSETTDATCTAAGKTVYTARVRVNGTEYTDTKEVTIARKEHSYGEPTFHWAEDNSCKASYVCSIGGETETVACSMTSETMDATCVAEGKTLYTAKVTVNGAEYRDTKEVTIAKKDHAYGIPVFTWAEDNSCKAAYTCSVGGETETTDCTVTSVTTPATCKDQGKIVYTASIVINGTEYVDVKEVVIEKQTTHTDADGNDICDICGEDLSDGNIETKVEIDPDFTDAEIPDELKAAAFDTVAKIETELKVQIETLGAENDNSVLYDAVLMYREEDGQWQRADETHFPKSGKLPVTLPVPAGTSPETHKYHAAHMFTSCAFGKTPGDVEVFENVPAVSDGKGGFVITIEVTGLSPILVSAEERETTPEDPCANGHSFTDTASGIKATEATCTEAATYYVKCDHCDAVSTGKAVAVGSANGHAYDKGVVTTAPTCTTDGVKTYTCANDKNHTYTEVVKATGHSFTKYISDGNATCKKDGTETAKCDNGCGKTDTRTDKGSKLGHQYENGKCIRCGLGWSWWNPKTGDMIMAAVTVLILSGAAILLLVMFRKKKQKK